MPNSNLLNYIKLSFQREEYTKNHSFSLFLEKYRNLEIDTISSMHEKTQNICFHFPLVVPCDRKMQENEDRITFMRQCFTDLVKYFNHFPEGAYLSFIYHAFNELKFTQVDSTTTKQIKFIPIEIVFDGIKNYLSNYPDGLQGLQLNFNHIPLIFNNSFRQPGYDIEGTYYVNTFEQYKTSTAFLKILELIKKGELPKKCELNLSIPYGLHDPYSVSPHDGNKKTTYFIEISKAIAEGQLQEGTLIALSVGDKADAKRLHDLQEKERNISEDEANELIAALKSGPKGFRLILDYKKQPATKDYLFNGIMKAIEKKQVPEDFTVHFSGKFKNDNNVQPLIDAICANKKDVHIVLPQSYLIKNLEAISQGLQLRQKDLIDSTLIRTWLYSVPAYDQNISKIDYVETCQVLNAFNKKHKNLCLIIHENILDWITKENFSNDKEKENFLTLIKLLADDHTIARFFLGAPSQCVEKKILYTPSTQFKNAYNLSIQNLCKEIQQLSAHYNDDQILSLVLTFRKITSQMNWIAKETYACVDDDDDESHLFFSCIRCSAISNTLSAWSTHSDEISIFEVWYHELLKIMSIELNDQQEKNKNIIAMKKILENELKIQGYNIKKNQLKNLKYILKKAKCNEEFKNKIRQNNAFKSMILDLIKEDIINEVINNDIKSMVFDLIKEDIDDPINNVFMSMTLDLINEDTDDPINNDDVLKLFFEENQSDQNDKNTSSSIIENNTLTLNNEEKFDIIKTDKFLLIKENIDPPQNPTTSLFSNRHDNNLDENAIRAQIKAINDRKAQKEKIWKEEEKNKKITQAQWGKETEEETMIEALLPNTPIHTPSSSFFKNTLGSLVKKKNKQVPQKNIALQS